MSSRNYIIPTDSMTFTDQLNYRLKALAAGIVRAFEQGIGSWDPNEIPKSGAKLGINDVLAFLQRGGWPVSLDVREFQPIQDAGTPLDFWNTLALAAAGTEYSVFQNVPVPAIGLRAKKLVVWYKVQIEDAPVPVSRLVFRRTAAAGSIISQFDLEQLLTQQRVDGFLSEPVVWDPNMPYAINVMARNVGGAPTGVLAVVVLGNFVFEPAGATNI